MGAKACFSVKTMSSLIRPEWETQALERIKRALAHERATSSIEQKTNFISLMEEKPKCKLVIGANASIRSIQQKEATLLVIAGRVPLAVKDTFIELAKANSCSVWIPNVSSKDLGKIVGLNRSSCLSFAFLQPSSNELDPMTSILCFVLNLLKNLESKPAVNEQDHKRLHLEDSET
jgi:ribosomal protein L30E